MGTLDVVRVDLQLGLGIDLGLIGQQQVYVGLLGVGLLGVFVSDDASAEHGPGPAVQNTLVELPTVAVRLGVLHQHVVVDVLAAAEDVQAVQQ